MQLIRQLLSRPLYRYLIVGGSVYVLELLIISVAQRAGASAVVAVTLSFWIGLTVSFILQKLFTFGDKRLYRRTVVKQVIAVAALVLWNFLFTLLVTKLLVPHVSAIVARTIALIITTTWNFYLYKTKIFKQHPSVPLDV